MYEIRISFVPISKMTGVYTLFGEDFVIWNNVIHYLVPSSLIYAIILRGGSKNTKSKTIKIIWVYINCFFLGNIKWHNLAMPT